jgi:hypothetical protein
MSDALQTDRPACDMGVPSFWTAILMTSRGIQWDSFDVFRDKPDDLLWIGAAPSMEKALERARKHMGEHGRCDYLIVDMRNGTRTVVTPERLDPDHCR